MGQPLSKGGFSKKAKRGTKTWRLRKPRTNAIFDLGDDILKRIIRFTVVQPDSIVLRYNERPPDKPLPGAVAFGPQVEKWAQEFYFSENHFEFRDTLTMKLWAEERRHLASLLRSIHFVQNFPSLRMCEAIKLCKGLQELHLNMDEPGMMRIMCKPKNGFQDVGLRPEDIDRQLNLLVLRTPCMANLRQLRVPKVLFLPSSSSQRGAIPGGVLQTLVAKEMMSTVADTPKKMPRKRKLASTDSDADEYIPRGKRARTKSNPVKNKNTGDCLTARAKQTSPVQPSCRLLELPAEIRNLIYSFVLQVDGNINPSKRPPATGTNVLAGRSRRPIIAPEFYSVLALLQACKQICTEAVGVYYSENAFVFYFPMQLLTFLHVISDERKAYIHEVTVWTDSNKQGDMSFTEAAFMALTTLRNLKILHVNLDSKAVYSRRLRAVLPCHDTLQEFTKNGVEVILRNPDADYAAYESTSNGRALHPAHQAALARVNSWQDSLASI